ncbi:MAG: S4 domain-containing protein YaaA [Bacteroidaceae bacterium]|nr:S4 domain-containing protein YaaA [Bacteroidaceae bacterium]
MIKKTTQITITTEYITLGQFLKFADIIGNGGEAKSFLAENEVRINSELDNRRGRKLRGGEIVEVLGQRFEIKR